MMKMQSNRTGVGFFLAVVCFLFTMSACKSKSENERLAGYVANEGNGLTKRAIAGDLEIVSQLIPEEKEGKGEPDVYRFMIYMNTKPAKMTDSILYYFNYQSRDLFRLIKGKDTLAPVLSERIANGRKETNQFTVVFDTGVWLKKEDSISLFLRGYPLFSDSLVFLYSLKDISKASKSLYGYE